MQTKLISEDGTVQFVPERLNRDPVVLRGLTNNEMFMVTVVGCSLGLLSGLAFWVMFGQIAMIPTCLFAGGGAALFFGGSLLRRAKRGKPETWFYRNLQWQVMRRFGLNVGTALTTRSGFWSVRREKHSLRRSPPKKVKKGFK